ncbi:MAG: PilT/PilU family type 4a pilus ATPase [Candidatus Omnitrophica bacterium]|nr:PilT/PilU family type 4a pilus ATPase [Candidatus Omnitrophota bacterium]
MNIHDMLKHMIKKDASDLHLKVGSFPILRINRALIPQENFERLTHDMILRIIDVIADENQKREFYEKNEVDYAYISNGIGRFRVNIFKQRGECGIVMRRIKEVIPTFEELNLPNVFEKIASQERGIILITGAASSGKTTTMASIINYINKHKNKHVMTLENPIEYIHRDIMSVINQREIGVDTDSFHEALRHVIRQDPDVIVIGEMRDRESVTTSVSSAETGHLVLSSFHAEDTVQAVRRMLDYYAETERNIMRGELANNIKAITCQRLVKCLDSYGKAEGVKLIPATEILIVTPIVAKLIHDGKYNNIYKILQSGDGGMHSFNMSLIDLFKNKKISKEEALSKSSNPEALKINLKGIYLDQDKAILG